MIIKCNNKNACGSKITVRAGDRKQEIYNWWPKVITSRIASATCVISIIIHAPAVEVVHRNKFVYKRFLLLQLPYCVSVLLLTSGCKSAAVQYKRRYHLTPPQSILTKQT